MFRLRIPTSNLALLSAIALLSAQVAPARAQRPDAQEQAAALLSASTQTSVAPHPTAGSGFDRPDTTDAQQQAGQVLIGSTHTARHRVADATPSPRHVTLRRVRRAVLDHDDAQTVAGRLLSGKVSD